LPHSAPCSHQVAGCLLNDTVLLITSISRCCFLCLQPPLCFLAPVFYLGFKLCINSFRKLSWPPKIRLDVFLMCFQNTALTSLKFLLHGVDECPFICLFCLLNRLHFPLRNGLAPFFGTFPHVLNKRRNELYIWKSKL